MYATLQNLTAGRRFRETFAREFIRPFKGARVLDVGCGTADILDVLPEVRYHGIDLSQQYIEKARQRYGSIASFEASNAILLSKRNPEKYDIVLAMGVLHHVDDDGAAAILCAASNLLRPGGRFISIDPTYVEPQHPVARFLISKDRGMHVRREEAMLALSSSAFVTVRSKICHELYRIPYTHVIMECQNGH